MQVERITIIFKITGEKQCSYLFDCLVFLIIIRLRWLKNKINRYTVYYLETVVGPRAKFHHTRLFVKREKFYIYFTGRLVNSWRFPLDPTTIVEHSLSGQSHFEISVST